MDWLIWFLLPRGLDTEYRRARIDGTSDPARVQDATFRWIAYPASGLVALALVALIHATGLAGGPLDHPLVVGPVAFFVVLAGWTLVGADAVRSAMRSDDDRWARRAPLLRGRRGARGARGRDCR